MEYLLILIAIVIILIIVNDLDRRKLKKKAYKMIEEAYGSFGTVEFSEDKMNSISSYCDSKRNSLYLDDITWNDLNMFEVYRSIDTCNSCIGEEYLYSMLRNPASDFEVLKDRENIISFFETNKKTANDARYLVSCIGRLKSISFYEYCKRLGNVKRDSSLVHVLLLAAFMAAVVSIAFLPAVGVFITIIIYFVNMLTYFKRKSDIEAYYSVLRCFLNVLSSAEKLALLDIPVLRDRLDEMQKAVKRFDGMKKRSFLVLSTGEGVKDIMQSVLDYLRMALHLDLIFFNRMIDIFMSNQDSFECIFEVIGMTDALLAVESYRSALPFYCRPDFSEACEGRQISIADVYHPLISDAVCNSISENSSCLITGSNASGKSTFIRTVAVSAVLAETIDTVPAKEYKAPLFKIMSSMALKDNLLGGESYYIVEIRSLKRIFDSLGDIPLLCFIDEVLRGTNTIERVAASANLLSRLAVSNAFVFAATHDLELTYILENVYRNYHFEEQVTERDVLFDYRLRDGRSHSKNAISLLKRFDFPEEVTSGALSMADLFAATGSWPVI